MTNKLEKSGKKIKKEGKFSKLILGLVVGGAVGSVVGMTLSDKDKRDKLKKKSVQAFHSSKQFISDYRNSRKKNRTEDQKFPEKRGFWHMLHRLVHGTKNNTDKK